MSVPNDTVASTPSLTTAPSHHPAPVTTEDASAHATAGSSIPATTGAPLDVASTIDTVATTVKAILPTSNPNVIPTTDPQPKPTGNVTEPPQAPGTPSLPPRPEEENPNVTSLRAMFPDFDAAILQSVLDSVDGDQDRAIEALLGMSDPDYVSKDPPQRPRSEISTDEELAKRLAYEEEDAHARRQIGQQVGQPAGEERYQTFRPGAMHPTFPDPFGYATASSASQVAPQSANDDITFADVQKQISQIAETGRKTFSSIFSKVKAKFDEFEQSQSTVHKPATPAGAGPMAQPGPTHPPSRPPSYFDPRFGASNAGPSGTVHSGNTPSLPMTSPKFSAPTQAQPAPTRGSLNAASINAGSTGLPGSSPLARSSVPVVRTSNDTPRPPMTSTGPPTPSGERSDGTGISRQSVPFAHDARAAQTHPAPGPVKKAESEDDLGYM